MLIAPMTRPGVVLSQPPISTAPSIGWLRSSSSVSMARKLRYIMVDGFTNGLRQRHRRQFDREAAGLQHAALDVLGARAQVARGRG